LRWSGRADAGADAAGILLAVAMLEAIASAVLNTMPVMSRAS
jgi:hypothetical protein